MQVESLISIIILNYNGGKLVEECIDSVLKSDYTNFEVILVDNNSKDDSHKKCKELFPNILLIENKENLGFCGGNNVGIRAARGEYVVILNPDTVVEPDWLRRLYDAYKSNGEGLYQPKLLATSNHRKINSCGNMIQVFGFGYSRGKGAEDSCQFDNYHEINYASGACLFTSKDVICKIGLFDSFLFAYHDDLDLGWRASLMNIKSYYVPSAVVYHAESFSFKWSKLKFYLLERNRLYCILTHYSKRTFYRMLPSLVIIEIMMLLFYLVKGMPLEKIRGYSSIIKNRKIINEKYNVLQKTRLVSDREIILRFQLNVEIPLEVASSAQTIIFNKILSALAHLTKSIL